MVFRFLAALIVPLALVLSAVPAVAQEDATQVDSSDTSATRVMTKRQAGRHYLEAICPVNAAGQRFSNRIWRKRKSISRREVRRRLPELRRHSARYARATHRAARVLYNSPGDWPSSVERYVMRIAESYEDMSYYIERMAVAPHAQAWMGNAYYAAIASRTGKATNRVRARLDLPPPGGGC